MIYASGSLVKFVDKLGEMGYIRNVTQRQAYAGEEERLIEERLRALGCV
jgi:hypothetical protein